MESTIFHKDREIGQKCDTIVTLKMLGSLLCTMSQTFYRQIDQKSLFQASILSQYDLA